MVSLFIQVLRHAAVGLHKKALHAVGLAGLHHVVIKGILRVAGGVRRPHPQEIVPRREGIDHRFRQPDVRLRPERCRELVVLRQLGGVDDVLGVQVERGIPQQPQLFTGWLRHPDVERHRLVQALTVGVPVLGDLPVQPSGHGVVLRPAQRLVEDIRLLPDEGLHHTAVLRRHLPDAFRAAKAEQFLHGGVQLFPEAPGLQTAAEEHVAPVVAHAPLPAQAVGIVPERPLGAGKHGVVVPVGK